MTTKPNYLVCTTYSDGSIEVNGVSTHFEDALDIAKDIFNYHFDDCPYDEYISCFYFKVCVKRCFDNKILLTIKFNDV